MMFLLTTTFLFSQARIGKTVKELQKEYTNVELHYTYSDIGCIEMILLDFEDVVVMHQISKFQTVLSTAIAPKTLGLLVQMKIRYNKLYILKSENRWKGPGDTEILLLEGDDENYMFIWYDILNVKPDPKKA